MVSTAQLNFTATGITDVDGDSTQATYQTTKSSNPNNPTTAPDVYQSCSISLLVNNKGSAAALIYFLYFECVKKIYFYT